MVRFLLKTPLTALFFAALLHFFTSMAPFSQGYSEVLAAFSIPLTGYAFMVAYGMWLSIIMALIFANARTGGVKLVLILIIPVFATQWLVPSFYQFYYGDATGSMSRYDLLVSIVCGCICGLLLLIMAALLFKKPPEPETPKKNAPAPIDKYKIKKLDLAVKLIVVPIIYCVMYFLIWYFLLWRSEDVRVYYTGSPELRGFIEEMINMLLTNASRVPVALLEGLAYSLIILPLLMQLVSRRVMFIVTTILLFMGPAVRMLIPSPVMPGSVRMAYLVEISAISVVFGALMSFMLHMSMRKEETGQATRSSSADKSGANPKPATPAKAPAANTNAAKPAAGKKA